MANLNPPRRGVLIGSSGMLFTDQMATDIYFQDYWVSVGLLHRVAVICIGWGMSVAVIESAVAHEPGQPGAWTISHARLHNVVVQNLGVHPFPPPAPLPHNPHGQPFPPLAFFLLNGQPVQGHIVPWHYRVELRRAGANQSLHYHQHKPRRNHTSSPPPIKPNGSHKELHSITYSTQIQNYRRATLAG